MTKTPLGGHFCSSRRQSKSFAECRRHLGFCEMYLVYLVSNVNLSYRGATNALHVEPARCATFYFPDSNRYSRYIDRLESVLAGISRI